MNRGVAIVAVVACVACAATALADDRQTTTFAPKVVASGPVKAYRGPEAELVLMLEINDGKEMLVQARNVDGGIDGKSLRYLIDDRGDGDVDVYVAWKRGSKPYRRVVASSRARSWEFFHPTRAGTQFAIRYSETVSEKFHPDDLLNAYHP